MTPRMTKQRARKIGREMRTLATLLTAEGTFLDRKAVTRLCTLAMEASTYLELAARVAKVRAG
jgi:hypothetical protein